MRRNPISRLGTDIFMFLVGGIGLLLVLLLPHINEESSEKAKEDISSKVQGNLIVELYWEDGRDSDVDLWVMGSADMIPVGFSNKGAPLFNLLRDDTGVTADMTDSNMEIAYSRGLADGDYIINAHAFNSNSGYPIEVELIVRQQKEHGTKKLIQVNSELIVAQQEKTMARFEIQDGEYIPDSLHFTPYSILNHIGERRPH